MADPVPRGEGPVFIKRHGFKKVVLIGDALVLEQSLGPLARRRREYRLDSIESVRFHRKVGVAHDAHGSFGLVVSGFTLMLKDGTRDGWWSRTPRREPWRGLAEPLYAAGVSKGERAGDPTRRSDSGAPDRLGRSRRRRGDNSS
jgi:hypothetical protein